MLESLHRLMHRLRRETSGNAAMLVAIGMPALIGGTGLATDAAQWYLWQRDLQYAVDQAALAGAYARASANTTVQSTYVTRATQEYELNIQTTKDFDTGPTVTTAIYGTAAAANSVVVTASATKALPFSRMLTGASTTVSVRAQATFHGAANFTACMLALNPTASQAFKLGNSVEGSSSCGVGALSNDSQAAIKETGDNNIPLGTIVSGGAVDETFNNNGTVFEDQVGLSNPYEDIPEPTPVGGSQTYPGSCPAVSAGGTTYTANGSTVTHTTYKYYRGSNSNNWTELTGYTGTGYIAPSSSSPVAFVNKSVTGQTTTGLQAATAAAAGATVGPLTGNGSNRIWRVPYTSTQDTIDTITTHTTPASDGKVYLNPGQYASINIACPTVFTPGIYFVSGALDFGQNQTVTATGGVMFALTGSSGSIHLNSNSNVTLSGIAATTLTTVYGYSAADAAKLNGMLIWDPNSTAAMTVNGNASMNLSGILYMPKRDVTFNGNGSGGSAANSCMMIAADMIKITGNFSLTNFCVTTGASAMSIGGTQGRVRLVS